METLLLTNLILPLIKDYLKDGIKKVFADNKSSVSADEIERKFQEYLRKRYAKFQILDTLVFPNEQTKFDKLYEPLYIREINPSTGNELIKIDSFKENFLPIFEKAIIQDTAGMGKSTISKKLFLSAIEEKIGVPFLIELRHLSSTNTLVQEIVQQVSPLKGMIPENLILELLSGGNFIFIFDGFDEIGIGNKDFVFKDLKQFIDKTDNNKFLITSRPEPSLSSFGDFKKFFVKPLSQEEAFNIIRRYDHYAYKSISEDLIAQLNNQKDHTLKEYLTNPFLVSLLYKSFDFKKNIPIKKSHFYQQVYDALFENHDLSKEGYLVRPKNSNLHIDDFERVLRYLAYFTSIENQVEYDKNNILKYIQKSKKHLTDLNFQSSDFLKDLVTTVPLFKKEGISYKWAHKSLQDYFAAKFIWIDAKENQIAILKKISTDIGVSRFFNLLVIYYELDPKTFNHTIVYRLLLDFKNHDEKIFNGIPRNNQLKRRIELMFNQKDFYFVIAAKKDNKALFSPGEARVSAKESAKITSSYNKLIPFKVNHTEIRLLSKFERLILQFNKKYHNSTLVLLKLVSQFENQLIKPPRHIIPSTFPDLKEKHAYPLDDDPDNQINSKQNFSAVNDVLFSEPQINFDVAYRRLRQIEKEKEIQKDNDFLAW